MSIVHSIGGNLVDYRFERVTIACTVCARRGVYRIKSLRSVHGNPPMADLPRLVAMKGGCQLAIRYPGTACDAHFEQPNIPATFTYLAEAQQAGWRLILQCERSRQGLKSARPCVPSLFRIDGPSLIAALGHDYPLERLERSLHCPLCNTSHYSLHWVIPPTRPPDAGRAAA